VFADNYFREGNGFNGEVVDGARNYRMNDDVFAEGGYTDAGSGPFDPGPHNDVHLWYHGTVTRSGPINDGRATVSDAQLASWYGPLHPPRLETGYNYSRVAQALAPSGDRWDVSDGIGEPFGGDGIRQTVSVTATDAWPNVEIVSVGNSTVTQGSPVRLSFRWDDKDDASVTLRSGFDTNANPHDGVRSEQSRPVNADGDELVSTAGLSGNFFAYVSVSDGTHTRYYYTPRKVTINAPTNTGPSINVLSATPNPVARGQSVTLQAAGVADANGVQRVDFYRDSNANGVLNLGVDESLGQGTRSGSDWSRSVATGGLALGTHRFFAVGYDTLDTRGGVAYRDVAVQDTAASTPSITAIGPATLQALPLPQTQTLTIHGSNFTASSRLTFTDPGGGTYADRVPT